MKELILAITLLGNYTVTAYQSVRNQTDASPYTTSIGERTSPHGVAVSQDWLDKKIVSYGDLIYIEDVGWRIVNDCMNERYRERFDIWVANNGEESSFHKRFANRKLKIWRVRRSDNGSKNANYQNKKKLQRREEPVLGLDQGGVRKVPTSGK